MLTEERIAKAVPIDRYRCLVLVWHDSAWWVVGIYSRKGLSKALRRLAYYGYRYSDR